MANETILSEDLTSSQVSDLIQFGKGFGDERFPNAVFRPGDMDVDDQLHSVSGNTYVISRDTTTHLIVSRAANLASAPVQIRSLPFSSISTLTFSGDDRAPGNATINLVIDFTNGDPIPPGGLAFDGGGSTSTLKLINQNTTGPTRFVSEILQNGDKNSGTITIADGAGIRKIAFANTSAINDTAPADHFAWNSLRTSSSIALTSAAGSNTLTTTTSTNGAPAYTFSGKPTVTLLGGSIASIWNVSATPSLLTLLTGFGGDVVNIVATSTGTSTTIGARGAGQTFNVGQTSMDGILGNLSIIGVGVGDELNMIDASMTAHHWRISSSTAYFGNRLSEVEGSSRTITYNRLSNTTLTVSNAFAVVNIGTPGGTVADLVGAATTTVLMSPGDTINVNASGAGALVVNANVGHFSVDSTSATTVLIHSPDGGEGGSVCTFTLGEFTRTIDNIHDLLIYGGEFDGGEGEAANDSIVVYDDATGAVVGTLTAVDGEIRFTNSSTHDTRVVARYYHIPDGAVDFP